MATRSIQILTLTAEQKKMPPKGKKGKSKEQHQPLYPLILLQPELDKKVRELAEIKMRVRTAQEVNNSLNKEANKMQIEMNEYTHFMSKKTNLRQTQIVTLTDYHRQEIEDINRDKEKMIKEYQQKKEELRSQLIKKSQRLLEAKHELETMDGYKIIRDQKSDEIKRLQNEITRIRGKHVHEIARVKATFETQIRQQRANGDINIKEIQRQANQEAEQFLHDQTLTIRRQNIEFRKKLQDILKRQQNLNELKQSLEEDQLHLIRRLKLVADLRKIRLDKVSSDITNKSSKSKPHQ